MPRANKVLSLRLVSRPVIPVAELRYPPIHQEQIPARLAHANHFAGNPSAQFGVGESCKHRRFENEVEDAVAKLHVARIALDKARLGVKFLRLRNAVRHDIDSRDSGGIVFQPHQVVKVAAPPATHVEYGGCRWIVPDGIASADHRSFGGKRLEQDAPVQPEVVAIRPAFGVVSFIPRLRRRFSTHRVQPKLWVSLLAEMATISLKYSSIRP